MPIHPNYHPSLHPPKIAPPQDFLGRLAVVFEMIKFRHSFFALPFALASMLVAADGWPRFRTLFWIIIACVAARSMGMAFNRLVDRGIDARNPRTSDRALPAGLLSLQFTLGFIIASAMVFVFASAMLNLLCLLLSPFAIALLLGYSYCKSFTSSVHLVLGAALGLAPLGAWIAVRGSLEGLPIFLALGVLFWTAGFDIIYSCLDVDVDRRERLHSIPARVGIRRGLLLARGFHLLAAICFTLFTLYMSLGIWTWLALALIFALIALQHRMVNANDLSKVGPAFFTANAAISILFLIGCSLDVLF